MRLISIGDDKGRDALVGIESCLKKCSYQRFNTKRLVKSTLKTDISTLMKENADDEMKVAEQIIKTDDDIDFINDERFSAESATPLSVSFLLSRSIFM